MPYWTFVPLRVAASRVLSRVARPSRQAGVAGRVRRLARSEAGFSTAEGLAGAALAVVALIAIWAAMRTFGLDIVRWMQDQITSQG
ncbi:MAG TPA: hypothetical protein VFA45_07175 [Actinomycetes bacterium]|jgi:hypothetical protein|nr:hypothetical protein [Actinomycetes bacterium]